MVERTAGLVRDLTADPACDATLVHTDLHYRTSCTASPAPTAPTGWPSTRTRWPGTRASRSQPLLRNRRDELGSGSAFRYLVRRRVEVTCESAGIDEDQALAWTYVQHGDATPAGRPTAATPTR